MKKLTAILLALILVFSLSATALAASGESDVTVEVNSTNISVTLPIDITVTALVDGGSATVPTEGTYKIINNSAIPIKVDTIKVVLNDNTNWAFKNDPIAAGTVPNDSSVNEIYLSVNGQVLKVQDATPPTNATTAELPWNIPANTTKNLPLVCSTSKLNQMATEENLITITYVVSAGSHTVSTPVGEP